MSEMKDLFIYNFYDYMKSIYVYSHVKTNLVDTQKQIYERSTIIILAIFSFFFIITTLFKVFVIIFYFIFIQAFAGFIKFIISLFKTKCHINFCSSFKNSIFYLGKVFKRIYTFNFYLFDNKLIGLIMVGSYFLFLISSTLFYYNNIISIEKIEKDTVYLHWFYIHFESFILVQLLYSSFYALRDMKWSTLLAFLIAASMNGMLFLGYTITRIIENADGTFENNEPQKIMNIIFNTILFFLNAISLYNTIIYKKNCKFLFLIILYFYFLYI